MRLLGSPLTIIIVSIVHASRASEKYFYCGSSAEDVPWGSQPVRLIGLRSLPVHLQELRGPRGPWASGGRFVFASFAIDR